MEKKRIEGEDLSRNRGKKQKTEHDMDLLNGIHKEEDWQLDAKATKAFKQAGKELPTFMKGEELPEIFKRIFSLEESDLTKVLNFSKPDTCSPRAMYEVSRIFSSNPHVKAGVKEAVNKAQIFYGAALFERVKNELHKHGELDEDHYETLTEAVHSSFHAFFAGIVVRSCEVYTSL